LTAGSTASRAGRIPDRPRETNLDPDRNQRIAPPLFRPCKPDMGRQLALRYALGDFTTGHFGLLIQRKTVSTDAVDDFSILGVW
jgi:hypothetical protein